MQVTPEMARAAWQRWLEIEKAGGMDRDAAMRYAVQAALDVASEVAVDVTANIRIQIDETEFRSSVAEAVERLHGALPRNAEGRVTLATLHGATTPPAATVPDEILSTDGFEDAMATAMQHRIPVTEPRPLATVGELHHYLGESREFVLHAAAGMPEYDPPFPDPVREYGEDREPLYDPEAVKAWYDALPQAADG